MAGKKFKFSTRPLGEVLLADFMTPKNMGREDLEAALQIDGDVCEALLDGRASISGDVAIGLADLFDNNPEYWMNIQSERDLDEARWRKHQKASRYYFLHIKKCVGTTLIGLANNQENVEFHQPHANGNPAIDDPSLAGENRYVRYWEFDKKEHKEFLLNQDYNFIANEVHLGDEFDHHPSLIYFTILRDPVKRALSQFYHMRHLNEKISADVDSFLNGKSDNAKVFNNYMTFQITGKVVKGYDETVVAEAIKRLEKFDHILFQETFAEDIAEFVDYGWDINLMSDRNVRSKAQKDNPSDETLEKLSQRLSSDQAVYDHFWEKRKKAKNKAQKASAFASSQSYISTSTLFFPEKWETELSELQELQKAQKKTNVELRERISERQLKFKESKETLTAQKEVTVGLQKRIADQKLKHKESQEILKVQKKANMELQKRVAEQHVKYKELQELQKSQKKNARVELQEGIAAQQLKYKESQEILKAQKKANMELRQRVAEQHLKYKEKAQLTVTKQEKIKALHEENKDLKKQISAMRKEK